MSATTKIQWADATLNPWEGCTKVSAGCANCYAEARDRRHLVEKAGHWGPGVPRRRVVGFEDMARAMNRQAIREGRRLRVFPSLCDWLDPEVPVEWLAEFLRVVCETPNLDWLLLTKRPERFIARIACAATMAKTLEQEDKIEGWWTGRKCAPSNVWIGVSVENQETADARLPELLKIPAAVRFVSVEPMLGPVDLVWGMHGGKVNGPCNVAGKLDWGIVGGETGPWARPCNVGWIRAVVRQCNVAAVPCFVKQLGSKPYFDAAVSPCAGPMDLELRDRAGADPAEWPEDLRVREFPR